MRPHRRSGFCALLIVLAALACAASIALLPLEANGAAASSPTQSITIRLDFIIGGEHTPWLVALDKGFYAKRGLSVKIEPGAGSIDTIKTIAAGNADVGFADFATTVVARSKGASIVMAAQMGLLRTTILWREESSIKTIKDLEGKSWAISPGQAQWYLMPAFFKINGLDFKTVKIQETAPALQPAALIAKKVDFVSVFRASNDEVTEVNAAKQGIKLRRVFMREAGLNIYGSGLIVREEDIKRRPEMIRSYIAATMEGVRYAKDNLDEALAILLKQRPEIDRELTRTQLKNALEEVYILPESLEHGYGFMRPDVVQKTVGIANEFFEVGRKVVSNEAYTNQFITK